MSVTVECPAAKYGKSSEFGVILDFIQTMISNDTLRHTFNIPHLVMVGRQNMAKTTLINRLIGRYLLPMRRNETANTLQARTTHPIILNLRNGDRTQVEVKCENIPKIGGKVENPTDAQVETFLTQMAERLPKEPGTPISKMPVSVTLEGKRCSFIRFIDLLGTILKQCFRICLRYNKKKACKTLVIFPAILRTPMRESLSASETWVHFLD